MKSLDYYYYFCGHHATLETGARIDPCDWLIRYSGQQKYTGFPEALPFI